MSSYDYVSRSGYTATKPVSIISYDLGRGTRTYVTRIESQVQEVRRPAAIEYSYSYSTKMEPSKENRPREVDEFITQILHEINGSPVSTTRSRSGPPMWDHHSPPAKADRWSDYGGDHMFGGSSPTKAKPKKDYGFDYMYGASPVTLEMSREYGDPYEQWDGWSGHHVYDQPSRRDYGVPSKQWDNTSKKLEISSNYSSPSDGSSVKSETLKQYGVSNNLWGDPRLKAEGRRDYQVPENQWERSSRPVYDTPPYNQPPIKPDDSRDYEAPKNRWGNSQVNQSPSDFGAAHNQGDNSRLRAEASKDYQVPKTQWERSSRPSYDLSPYTQPPIKPEASKEYETPKNQWKNSYVDPQSPRDQGVDNNQGKASQLKTEAPRDYQTLKNQWERSSLPVYDPPPYTQTKSEIGKDNDDAPKNRWGNSHVNPQSPRDHGVAYNRGDISSSPIHDHSPKYPTKLEIPKDLGVPYNHESRSPIKPQSPQGYGSPGNQWSRPSKPMFVQLRPSGNNDEVPNRQLGDSPKGTQTVKDYNGMNNQRGSPLSPVNDASQPNGNIGVVPNNQGGNSPVKTQSPRDHKSRDIQWGKSPSPVYDLSSPRANNGQHEQPNATSKDGILATNDKPIVTNVTYNNEPRGYGNNLQVNKPLDQQKDYGSSNWAKPNSYRPSPMGQTTSPLSKDPNNIGEASGQPKVAAKASAEGPVVKPTAAASLADPQQPQYSVYTPEKSRRVTMVSPVAIDSREAHRRYGGLSVPSRPYTDEEDEGFIITSKDALDKYKGSFVPW